MIRRFVSRRIVKMFDRLDPKVKARAREKASPRARAKPTVEIEKLATGGARWALAAGSRGVRDKYDIRLFIGSASATAFFCCIFAFIPYGIWDDLLCAIGFAQKTAYNLLVELSSGTAIVV